MSKNLWNHYFIIVKLTGLLLYMGNTMVLLEGTILQKCLYFFLMTLFLFLTIMTEMTHHPSGLRFLGLGEIIFCVLANIFFPGYAVIPVAITLLDMISLLSQRKAIYYLLGYGALLLSSTQKANLTSHFLVITLLILFYIQEKIIVDHYRSVIETNEETEGALKTKIVEEDKRHQEALHKSHLRYENQMLEDKNRISQALHDKLGHSINGSLYKLEAAKLLIEKKPDECQNTIQDVIDTLRESMDEIRMILRREKPDKKRMAQLSLQALCDECEERYHITPHLKISEESGKIPDNIWEILLDNTYEAVTNALKYANCKNIYIEILTLNEVVRCSIRDDGRGAATIEDGMGLSGMKKRVRDVKGYFDVETEVGLGFAINMVLPII